MIVACVFVKGYVNYSVDYVMRLRSMVRRHLPEEHTFICLTDQLVDCDRWIIDTPDHWYPWWAKIQLFNPRLFREGQKIMYLDLDSLVVDSLASVASAEEFTLIPHAGKFQGKGALKVVPRFNSSVMVWRAEEGYHLYNAWSKDVTSRLWGDQDWIGERMPGAKTFPLAWFPRLSETAGKPPFAEAKVVLAKKPKPHVAARQWPWFKELWR
jgi:hypothetical protein